MNNIQLSEEKARSLLLRLPVTRRAAFSAACAERLFPYYADYSARHGTGSSQKLRTALDLAWSAMVAEQGESDLDSQIEISSSLLIDEDDYADSTAAYADDAVAAVAYAIRCAKSGNVDDAVWACARVRSSIEYFIMDKLDLDPNDPKLRTTIDEHPLFFAELERQIRDLSELLTNDGADREVIAEIKLRAAREAKSLFQSAPPT